MQFPQEVIEQLIKDTRLDHSGGNLYGECPYCGGDEFGISLEDNHLFRCFRGKHCGEVGNIYTLLKYIGRTELLGDRDFYKETDVFNPLEKKNFKEDVELSTELPDVIAPTGWRRVYENEYLRSRDFTDAEFLKYEIGTTHILRKFKNNVIFLIRQDGFIKGYVARNKLSKGEVDAINKPIKEWNKTHPDDKRMEVLRYNNSTDADFSKILYGIDEAQKGVTTTAIIVEGLFDKINLEIICPELFEDRGIVVMCTWGKKISKYQMHKLKEKGINKAILLYDPDAIEDSKRYAFDLENNLEEVLVGYLEEKDPGDLNKEEFYEVMMNLQDPTTFYLDKLQKKTF